MPHHGMGNPIPKYQWYGLGIDMVWEMQKAFPIGISQLKIHWYTKSKPYFPKILLVNLLFIEIPKVLNRLYLIYFSYYITYYTTLHIFVYKYI